MYFINSFRYFFSDLKVNFLLKKKLFIVPTKNEIFLEFEELNKPKFIISEYTIKSIIVETNPTKA